MSELVPLLFLWLWSQRGSGGATSPSPTVPQWPTAASPPPPLPAFTPHAPAAATADTGTPLSQLHQAPPTPAHASKTATTTTTRPSAAKPAASAARRAASAASRAVHAATKLPGLSSLHSSGPPLKAADVLSIQNLVNARGGRLNTDGLYGPKTATAWSALAKKMGLPGTISRVGPKVARVAIQTYDALSVPPIP